MSHITLAQQGLAALETREWDEAVAKLSKALQTSANPNWLIGRSRALAGLKRHQEALEDANVAWHQAWERNKRPLLAEAQYRRAVAYLALGQFANADACCIYAMKLILGNPAVEQEDPAKTYVDENGFWTAKLEDAREEAQKYGNDVENSVQALSLQNKPYIKEWRMASTVRIQALNSMNKLPADDPGRKFSTSNKPEAKDVAVIKSNKQIIEDKITAERPKSSSDMPPRMQEFQTNATISVSIFAKGVNKEKLQVEKLPWKIRLDPVVYPNGEEKALELDLWDEIIPDESRYSVTPNKVELNLKKKIPSKWNQLKADAARKAVIEAAAKANLPQVKTSETKPDTSSSSTAAAPSYPTSSRTGPKNWDKIGADEGSDDEKDVNRFFKELYKTSTPDQQRAMMKSFTESNGTSLSTNWEDVRDRTVETVAPEGVEAKKWD